MIRKIWNQLAAKCVNRETVSYFIFGVLTTAVDWVGYFALYNMGYSVVFSQTMSWAAAVLFAFITNKLFVFASLDLHPKKIWSEFVPFVICRAATGVFTMIAMIVLVDGLGIHQDFICKIVVSAISLVLNYLFSKLFIFKSEKKREKHK
mgnify:CR=1 FL=1